MAAFIIGGCEYQTSKINAFTQLFIVRRLAKPVKSILSPELLKTISRIEKDDDGSLFAIVQSILEAFGSVSDDDLKYVILECCRVTKRNHNKTWTPILGGNDVLMFPDIDGAAFTKIVFEVVKENMGSFFGAFRSIWEQSGAQQTT